MPWATPLLQLSQPLARSPTPPTGNLSFLFVEYPPNSVPALVGVPSQPSAGESRTPTPICRFRLRSPRATQGPQPCSVHSGSPSSVGTRPLFLLGLVSSTPQCQSAFPTPVLPCSQLLCPELGSCPEPILSPGGAENRAPALSRGSPLEPPTVLQTTGSPDGVGFPVPAARCPVRSLQHALLAQVPAVSRGPPLSPGS